MRGALLAWLLINVIAVVAVGQYRVNTQIYGNTSSSVRYGRSYQPNYARQPSYNLLPSENRNLVYRSGALPSTLRMNYAAIGPMAPQGVAAYVPQPSSFRSSAVTTGNYVNTISPARITPMPPGPAIVPGAAVPKFQAPAGSVRYAGASSSAAPVSGFSLGSAPLSSSPRSPAPMPGPTPQSGSVRYSWKLSE